MENCAGQTAMLPSSWPHYVFTPVKSMVVGGNFLTEDALQKQFDITKLEEQRLQIDETYEGNMYTGFRDVMWTFVEFSLIPDLRQALASGADVTKIEEMGRVFLRELKPTKKSHLNLKKEQQDNMDAIFLMFNLEKTELRIDREALIAEQLQLAKNKKQLADQQALLKTGQDVLNARIRQYETECFNFHELRKKKNGKDAEIFEKRMKDMEYNENDYSKKLKMLQQRQKQYENSTAQLKKAREQVAKKQEDQKKEEQRVSMIEKANEGLRAELEGFKKRNDVLQSEVTEQSDPIGTLATHNKVLQKAFAMKQEDQKKKQLRVSKIQEENKKMKAEIEEFKREIGISQSEVNRQFF